MALGYAPGVHDSLAWFAGQIVTAALFVVLSLFFSACHTARAWPRLNALFDSMMTLRPLKADAMNRDILLFNYFAVLYNASNIAGVIIDANSSANSCKALVITQIGAYFVFNFLAYRVLLNKAAMYDAMSDIQVHHSATYWFMHLSFGTYAVVTTFMLAFGPTTLEPYAGTTRCAQRFPARMNITVACFFMLVLDTLVSVACLLLLLYPKYIFYRRVRDDELDQSSSRSSIARNRAATLEQIGINRNVVAALAAIVSTFVFVLYVTIVSMGGFYVVTASNDVALLDALVNLVAINLSWPLSFYSEAVRAHFSCPRCGSSTLPLPMRVPSGPAITSSNPGHGSSVGGRVSSPDLKEGRVDRPRRSLDRASVEDGAATAIRFV